MKAKEAEVEPSWLIKDRDWAEISKHPVVRQTDRHCFDLIAIMSRFMLRPPQLKEKKKYEKLRKEVQKAYEQEEIARDHLSRLVNNNDLFAAITSEIDLLEIVFGVFEDIAVRPHRIRHKLQVEILNKEHLLHLYDVIELKLGGAGRKGDDAVSLIVRFLNYLFYLRIGKPLSQSNADICLVCELYKVAVYGHDMTNPTAREKIRQVNRKWNANEVEAAIAKTNTIITPPLSDIILAIFLATNKRKVVSAKVWERHLERIQRIINLGSRSTPHAISAETRLP
jgi:hypothetical protein